MGLPAQRRDEQQTNSKGLCAEAVDPSSVSQPWEAVSPKET